MKKSAFTFMRNLSFVAASALLLATEVQAQVALAPIKGPGSYGTPSISTSAGDACLDYTSGIGNNHVYNFSGVSGLSTPTYSWSIVGGASIVGSATGSSVTVKPIQDSDGRYNKARLTIFYKGTIDSTIVVTSCPACAGVTPPPQNVIVKIPKSGSVSVDLYQKFAYPDQIVGNVCVSKNDSVAYSIRDLVSGNAAAGIGFDTYTWDVTALSPITGGPQYVAGDNSSETFKYISDPVVGTTYTISVTAGKCNVGYVGTPARTKTKTLSVKVPPAITSPSIGSTTCLNASTDTLKITNTTRAGISYSWQKAMITGRTIKEMLQHKQV